MLVVTLVFHRSSQPSDALLSAAFPQQRAFSVLAEVDVEVACTRPVHVVVEPQTLRTPGPPQRAGQQLGILTRQHGRRLDVHVVT